MNSGNKIEPILKPGLKIVQKKRYLFLRNFKVLKKCFFLFFSIKISVVKKVEMFFPNNF